MKKAIMSSIFSIAMASALYFGNESLHDFAYYVEVFLVALASVLFLSGAVKGEVARHNRDYFWLLTVSSFVTLAALIATGHPLLAAISFIVSCGIVIQSSNEKEKAVENE